MNTRIERENCYSTNLEIVKKLGGEIKVKCNNCGVVEYIDDPQPGGSTPSQYSLPEDAVELQDLIEYRGMNFALGNIFKACYRLGHCDHSDRFRDLNKIKWFAERLIHEEVKKNG